VVFSFNNQLNKKVDDKKKYIVINNLSITFSKSHLIKYFEKDEFIFFKGH